MLIQVALYIIGAAYIIGLLHSLNKLSYRRRVSVGDVIGTLVSALVIAALVSIPVGVLYIIITGMTY